LDKHTVDRRLRKITRKEEEKTLIDEGEKMSVFFMFTEKEQAKNDRHCIYTQYVVIETGIIRGFSIPTLHMQYIGRWE
jgi:hypothetical protein